MFASLWSSVLGSLNRTWFPVSAPVVKNQPASAGDARGVSSVLGLGRFPGKQNGTPPQYSYLENSMDRTAYGPWGWKDLGMSDHYKNEAHSYHVKLASLTIFQMYM